MDGSSLKQLAAGQVSDDLLVRLWAEVDKLHKAGIAHRSLRAANVMADRDGQPVIVDFSFSELAATRRQMDLDVAELLASLATLVGEDRATSAAVKVLGAEGVAPAVPLLQPLALSAGTRRAVKRQDGLLTRTRSTTAAASGVATLELVRVERVRPRTLLTIAALCGAYYYLLPQLAKVGNPWRALESAQWAWILVAIAFSALTYLASAIGLLGGVSVRVPFWPTVLTQGASSYINRVSPSNVGGMALNVRFLQKAGVEPTAGVAAVGVNSLAGALVHGVFLVIFFAWAGRGGAGQAFKLPSSSTLLVILAVAAAVIGIVIATRQGRRFAARKLLPSLRSSLASLRRVARSPARLTLLFGGSALVTLAYLGGLVASVEAFGGGASVAKIGAVYMVSAVAAASPTPGGVGAIEAALTAGLTGIGISSGAAVSAVVLYRLATYWLPVPPGWLSWRLLQRMDYVLRRSSARRTVLPLGRTLPHPIPTFRQAGTLAGTHPLAASGAQPAGPSDTKLTPRSTSSSNVQRRRQTENVLRKIFDVQLVGRALGIDVIDRGDDFADLGAPVSGVAERGKCPEFEVRLRQQLERAR